MGIKEKLYTIIFEHDTYAGKLFDVLLIISIKVSIVIIMLESVPTIRADYGDHLINLEWGFTVLFSIEYLFRLACAKRPLKYMFSFFGIIDFLAILPSYTSLFFPAGRYLTVIRIIRVLRIFRILKLANFVTGADRMAEALKSSRQKIIVFLYTVLTLVIVFGSLMYVIEGEESGFVSIPISIYWAIVTLTTVGYGDISPQTGLGQALSSVIMIIGYSIVAVPTGIVSAEITKSYQDNDHRTCAKCSGLIFDEEAKFCKHCGEELES